MLRFALAFEAVISLTEAVFAVAVAVFLTLRSSMATGQFTGTARQLPPTEKQGQAKGNTQMSRYQFSFDAENPGLRLIT